jgi:hypothetical protein
MDVQISMISRDEPAIYVVALCVRLNMEDKSADEYLLKRKIVELYRDMQCAASSST